MPKTRRNTQPRGVALWIIQIGFSIVVLWGVLAGVLITRWHSEYSQLKLALTSAAQTAVAQSYANDVMGSMIIDSQTVTADFQQATVSALGASGVVGCATIANAPNVCAQGGWGVPVNAALSKPAVVDIGLVNDGNNHFTVTAVMDPRPLMGIQVPFVAQVTTTVNLGYSTAIQAPTSN